MRISWRAGDTRGSAITGYEVVIQHVDGINYSPSTDCNMVGQTATSCNVPMSVLAGAPWNLVKNSQIRARVRAINAAGTGDQSVVGGTQALFVRPSTVTSLNLAHGNQQIVVDWRAPSDDGG